MNQVRARLHKHQDRQRLRRYQEQKAALQVQHRRETDILTREHEIRMLDANHKLRALDQIERKERQSVKETLLREARAHQRGGRQVAPSVAPALKPSSDTSQGWRASCIRRRCARAAGSMSNTRAP